LAAAWTLSASTLSSTTTCPTARTSTSTAYGDGNEKKKKKHEEERERENWRGTQPLINLVSGGARRPLWHQGSGHLVCVDETEEDASILNQVQERFEVNISELPDTIDSSAYMRGDKKKGK
jgi:hypothetical protein